MPTDKDKTRNQPIEDAEAEDFRGQYLPWNTHNPNAHLAAM